MGDKTERLLLHIVFALFLKFGLRYLSIYLLLELWNCWSYRWWLHDHGWSNWNSVPFSAGIPAVLWILNELYLAIICKKLHLGKTGSLFCTVATKFSHVIASARLGGMKTLINKHISLKKSIKEDRSYFHCIFTIRIMSICKKNKTKKKSKIK